MNPVSNEVAEEPTAPKNEVRTPAYLAVIRAIKTYLTIFLFVSASIASSIPLIQLIIGAYYWGQCPIDQRIAIYMFVSGVCGLILAVLSVFVAVLLRCFNPESAASNMITVVGLCLNLILTLVITIFLFVWFILGCVWVFSVSSKVQYTVPKQSSYCQPVLYQATFALLIFGFILILIFIQCCISCFRSCCTGRNE